MLKSEIASCFQTPPSPKLEEGKKKPSGEMQGVLFCLFITLEGPSFLDLLKTCKDIGKTGSGVWAAN